MPSHKVLIYYPDDTKVYKVMLWKGQKWIGLPETALEKLLTIMSVTDLLFDIDLSETIQLRCVRIGDYNFYDMRQYTEGVVADVEVKFST